MKIVRFIFVFSISIALFIVLNTSIKGTPPLGKLLSPHQGFWQNGTTEIIDLPENLSLPGL
jgi:penicillin amidase